MPLHRLLPLALGAICLLALNAPAQYYGEYEMPSWAGDPERVHVRFYLTDGEISHEPDAKAIWYGYHVYSEILDMEWYEFVEEYDIDVYQDNSPGAYRYFDSYDLGIPGLVSADPLKRVRIQVEYEGTEPYVFPRFLTNYLTSDNRDADHRDEVSAPEFSFWTLHRVVSTVSPDTGRTWTYWDFETEPASDYDLFRIVLPDGLAETQVYSIWYDALAVPEPRALGVLWLGAVGLAALRRSRRLPTPSRR